MIHFVFHLDDFGVSILGRKVYVYLLFGKVICDKKYTVANVRFWGRFVLVAGLTYFLEQNKEWD
jgi:hypothetical protein